VKLKELLQQQIQLIQKLNEAEEQWMLVSEEIEAAG
jgi:hypothetical protein